MADLSQEYLRSIFDYNPETGELTRKVRPRAHFSCDRTFNLYNQKRANSKVSTRNGGGYLIAVVDNVIHRAHRIAWIICNGHIDGLVIDHVNGVTDDNRLCNLRACSNAINLRNMASKNKSLPMGVYFDKSRGNYKASVGLGEKGKTKYRRFKTIEEAAEWRSQMLSELDYHELHGKKGA